MNRKGHTSHDLRRLRGLRWTLWAIEAQVHTQTNWPTSPTCWSWPCQEQGCLKDAQCHLIFQIPWDHL